MAASLGLRGAVAATAAFGLVLGMAACGEALRLEPPSGSTTGAGGGNGAGGGAPITCVSNSDCPAPTSVCDVAKLECVQCLVIDDCGAQPGTVCSQGQCICADGGSWCGPDTCVDLMTDQEHCGSCDRACFGSCVDGACADPWEPVGTEGAPSPRSRHVALWTGSHMIIWGGTVDNSSSNNLNTGAMYDPASREWTPMSTVNAPSPRQRATAVWTGTQMLVWGGRDGGTFFSDGAIYDPATNSWAPMDTANAPAGRERHVAIWADNVERMIVWGGLGADELGDGGQYDLAMGWTSLPQTPTAGETRRDHSAVWTGNEVLIHGGFGDDDGDAGATTPDAYISTGITFTPSSNMMSATLNGAPAMSLHSAVWTGTTMLLFGGFDGTNYLAGGNSFEVSNMQWTVLPPSGIEGRRGHTAVWVDSAMQMLVWGGEGENGPLNTGASYSVADGWAELPTVLEARIEHTAISTGDSMIIWGGAVSAGGARLNTGAVYRP